MKFEWLVGGVVVLDGIEFPGLKLFERGGVDEIVVGSAAKGFEDGMGLEDIGDTVLNGCEDFGVKEVGHLVKDGVLIGGMGADADFAESIDSVLFLSNGGRPESFTRRRGVPILSHRTRGLMTPDKAMSSLFSLHSESLRIMVEIKRQY
ncbi:hypothetical protein C1H46_028118 [Malus baccata]|uniref:Uncharacterized protein n=1 Tax=Malus baccata TaxID=106549 RepID=A0A540LIT3_MALBA|nr:hypothetical protein C1H46_028118 [Malus baccata]